MRSKLAIVGLLLSSIAAFSQTVSINYKVFSSGPAEVLAPFSVFHATPGETIILGVPKQILVQDPLNPSKPKTYTFIFWVVPSGPSPAEGPTTNTEVAFKVPPGGAHTTAWYQLTETGCSTSPPSGEPMTYAGAFDEDEDKLITGTPIASVNPSDLWNPNQTPNYVNISNTGQVVITAKPSMENQEFHFWLPLFPTVAAADGAKLNVSAKMATSAITFYHTVVTPPPPCQQWLQAISAAEVEIGEVFNHQPLSLQGLAKAKEDLASAEARYAACLKNPIKPPVLKK